MVVSRLAILCLVCLFLVRTNGYVVHLYNTATTSVALIQELQFHNLGRPIPKVELSASSPFDCYRNTKHDSACSVGKISGHNESLEIDTQGLYLDKVTMTARDCGGLGISVLHGETVIYNHVFSSCPQQQQLITFDLGAVTREAFPFSLVDLTLFNGEYSIALFRIKYLYDVIDEFVIIEARYPFSMVNSPPPKDTLFFMNASFQLALAPYMSKISFVEVPAWPPVPSSYQRQPWMSPNSTEAFWRENYQRLYAKDVIRNKKALIICADMDEIPSRDVVRLLRDESHYDLFNDPVYLKMMFFIYNFNWRAEYYWERAYIVNTQAFLFINDTLLTRVPGMRPVPLGEASHKTISPGGWHLSNFCSIDALIYKIESFAHTEKNKQEFKNRSYITSKLQGGLDLYNRSFIVHYAFNTTKDSVEYELPHGWEGLQGEVINSQR